MERQYLTKPIVFNKVLTERERCSLKLDLIKPSGISKALSNQNKKYSRKQRQRKVVSTSGGSPHALVWEPKVAVVFTSRRCRVFVLLGELLQNQGLS